MALPELMVARDYRSHIYHICIWLPKLYCFVWYANAVFRTSYYVSWLAIYWHIYISLCILLTHIQISPPRYLVMDFRVVNFNVWRFYELIHGGGPIICRRMDDIYSLPALSLPHVWFVNDCVFADKLHWCLFMINKYDYDYLKWILNIVYCVDVGID